MAMTKWSLTTKSLDFNPLHTAHVGSIVAHEPSGAYQALWNGVDGWNCYFMPARSGTSVFLGFAPDAGAIAALCEGHYHS